MARPCLDCLTGWASPSSRSGSRCPPCESRRNRQRNAQPKRRAYRDPTYRAIPLAGPCADCGATEDLTRDHVVPLSAGGTNDPANIRILCRTCNSRKGGGAESPQTSPSMTPVPRFRHSDQRP